MNSYEKYLKYKFKYLSLKQGMVGGAAGAPRGIQFSNAGNRYDFVSGPVALHLGKPLHTKLPLLLLLGDEHYSKSGSCSGGASFFNI